jgi:hypothetical protein
MKEFDSMLASLNECSIPIKYSEYDENAFGSWYVEIDSKPMYRVVHDGRDKTIVLEVHRNNEWNSLISDKTKSGKYLVEKLRIELNDL